MKVDAGRGKLYDAHLTIKHQWDEASETWNDGVRKDFEERVWLPLDQLAEAELRAIDRLARVLNECRRACQGEQ